MEARELRIGNWVLYKDAYYAVHELHPDYVVPLKSFRSQVPPSKIHGIPLTPEILEKCGFKYGVSKGIANIQADLGEDEEGDTHYWDMPVKRSNYCDRFTFSLVKWGDDEEYFTHSNQWYRARIKYLHQLQNLFYALTNTELPITL